MFISNAGLLLCSGHWEREISPLGSSHSSLYAASVSDTECMELNQFQVHLLKHQMVLTVSVQVYMTKWDHYSCSTTTATLSSQDSNSIRPDIICARYNHTRLNFNQSLKQTQEQHVFTFKWQSPQAAVWIMTLVRQEVMKHSVTLL